MADAHAPGRGTGLDVTGAPECAPDPLLPGLTADDRLYGTPYGSSSGGYADYVYRVAARELYGMEVPPGTLPWRALRNADFQVGRTLGLACWRGPGQEYVSSHAELGERKLPVAWCVLNAYRQSSLRRCMALYHICLLGALGLFCLIWSGTAGGQQLHLAHGVTSARVHGAVQELVLEPPAAGGSPTLRFARVYGFRNIQTLLRQVGRCGRPPVYLSHSVSCLVSQRVVTAHAPVAAVGTAVATAVTCCYLRPPAHHTHTQTCNSISTHKCARASLPVMRFLPPGQDGALRLPVRGGNGLPLGLPQRRRAGQAGAGGQPPAAAGAAGAGLHAPGELAVRGHRKRTETKPCRCREELGLGLMTQV